MLFGHRGRPPRVKVCGITNWTDAARAVEAGADALGFNFYPRSPRYIPPEEAARIVERLPERVTTVGVFVNEQTELIDSIMRAAGLDVVQLHGSEPARQVAMLAQHWPVIKAFRLRPDSPVQRVRLYSAATAFLVDAFVPGCWGGTGNTANWRLARRVARYGPLILAGGLRAENVEAAVRRVRPFAVDVCSGVESRPGQKDVEKLKAFFAVIRQLRRACV